MKKINKESVIGILVVLALILAVVLVFDQKETSAPTTTDGTETNGETSNVPQTLERTYPAETVIYSASGFTPESVTIKAGESVLFVNNSNEEMWVASAMHPTHEEYPEFDEKEAVSRGGIYEFTFTEVGEWAYHNHSNSEDTGKIVVTK